MLETERLYIELATLADKEFFFKLLNSLNWLKFIGDRGIKTMQDAENYIQNSLIRSYQEKGFSLYKITLKVTNKPVGICGFLKRDYLDSVDIGFAVPPEFERKGYIYEAAVAILEYGTAQLGFQTVYGITTEPNLASRHVLKKLGLHLVSRRTDNDQNTELLIFSNKS